ncbi:MAG: family 4 glycosyl hydrolase [Promethearchaeota archaeon]
MTINKKIVLIGAGSAAFGPATLMDISSSEILTGSTIVLVDINEEKLNRTHDILVKENEIGGNKFSIEKTTDRKEALKDADFIIVSIENGDRFSLRYQDNIIPRSHSTTEMMAENGGPGGFFHSARQIPEHVRIGEDIMNICPDAFLIVYSNPVSRISLALKRAVPGLKFIGLCHQIGLLTPKFLSEMMGRKMEEMKVITGGLNHFAFILGLEDWNTGENLLPEFNKKCWDYFKDKWDRFAYADLTFELYKRLKYFCYAGDNHVCEYLQVGSQYTKIEDIKEWLDMMDSGNKAMNDRMRRLHKRLKKGRYPKNGAFQEMKSGERAIPIIEAIIQDSNSYEMAVNIPNDGIITNLPQDLVLECSAYIDKNGAHGVKLGDIPKQIAAILRIEATIQDLCVEAILKKSKELAIACLATDVNCGSFERAEAIFEDMMKVQRHYLPDFK